MFKIGICIATCNRPQGLSLLLESITKLEFKRDIHVCINIADNDIYGSASETVENFKSRMLWQVNYAIEPTKGIPYARNKSIELAGDVDFIIFVDDDEIVDKYWLDELLDAQMKYNADVVTGPVLPSFDGKVPNWIIEGKFFEPETYPDGYKMKLAPTGNTLVKYSVLKNIEGPFNTYMALTGGSDSQLFKRIYEHGGKIIWCNKAKVTEIVKSNRYTIRWILQRSYRYGNTIALCEKTVSFNRSKIWRLKLVIGGIARITKGLLLFFPFLYFRLSGIILSLRLIFKGIGMVVGAFGFKYEEYKYV